MSDAKGTHKRLIVEKLREQEIEEGRQKYVTRIANATAASLGILSMHPLDAVEVATQLAAAYGAKVGIPIEDLVARVTREYAACAEEFAREKAKKALVQPPH